MIPRPLAWGIAGVLTILEALNVVAAIWVPGYHSDALVHFSFTTVVGFMLGMKEGNTAIARALTVVRNIANPPASPADPDAPPVDEQEKPAP